MRKTPIFLEEKTISLSTFKKDSKLNMMTTGDAKSFKRQLLAQKEVVTKEKDLDLLLIMDCTSSMSSWIKQSADNLVKIIDTVRQTCSFKATIRAAYVGYRDFGDMGDRDHFDVLDYTSDLK